MNKDNAQVLIDKYLQGKADARERALVERWYMQKSDQQQLGEEDDFEHLADELWTNTKLKAGVGSKRAIRLWPRIAAVAAAMIGIALCIYFFFALRHSDTETSSALAAVNDIAPGKYGATITLANGKVIQLSDTKTGVVIGNDKLAYNDGSPLSPQEESIPEGESSAAAKDMTAKTTKGQTYIFTLPDGTKVWLNADSKISFPSQFSGKERKILLDGEGYFEVAKNKAKPFIVQSGAQEVEVLGTHFNVNAYKDEGIVKTTLLEGSVRVVSLLDNKTSEAVIIKPNQQATLAGNKLIQVKEVDPHLAVAWKNNQFLFDETELGTIMRMVARWYDVEIVFTDDINKEKFGGGVSRFDKISKVLKSLETTGKVHFKVEGRKVYVSK